LLLQLSQLEGDRSMLLTDEQIKKLETDHFSQDDFFAKPVVRLFIPGTQMVWLIAKINKENHNVGWGIYNDGTGMPQVRFILLDQLEEIALSNNRKVARDDRFRSDFDINTYMTAAHVYGRYTEN